MPRPPVTDEYVLNLLSNPVFREKSDRSLQIVQKAKSLAQQKKYLDAATTIIQTVKKSDPEIKDGNNIPLITQAAMKAFFNLAVKQSMAIDDYQQAEKYVEKLKSMFTRNIKLLDDPTIEVWKANDHAERYVYSVISTLFTIITSKDTRAPGFEGQSIDEFHELDTKLCNLEGYPALKSKVNQRRLQRGRELYGAVQNFTRD